MVKEIFRPFKSFKPRNEGQGLGLSLAKETIARHQGSIEVRTVEGKESTFVLTFPL